MLSRGRICHYCVMYGVKQIHISSKSYNINKQAKMMAKLLTGSLRKRKNWVTSEKQANISVLPTSKSFQESSVRKRRTDVLNKLFMTSITDLLSTGEIGSDLLGRGVSITRVKVSPDFNVVNVFWKATGATHDLELENIFQNVAFELRHELCQLHVMGVVPRIKFVADKMQLLLENTEMCFEKLKLEGDLLGLDIAEPLKSEHSLEVSLEHVLLEKIEEAEYQQFLDSLPKMTHDVMGLSHSTIMKKIEGAVQKSAAVHRILCDNEHDMTFKEPSADSIPFQIKETDIAAYIKKQRIKKTKAMREQKKELLAEQFESKTAVEHEYLDIDDGDFIEEFENEKL